MPILSPREELTYKIMSIAAKVDTFTCTSVIPSRERSRSDHQTAIAAAKSSKGSLKSVAASCPAAFIRYRRVRLGYIHNVSSLKQGVKRPYFEAQIEEKNKKLDF